MRATPAFWGLRATLVVFVTALYSDTTLTSGRTIDIEWATSLTCPAGIQCFDVGENYVIEMNEKVTRLDVYYEIVESNNAGSSIHGRFQRPVTVVLGGPGKDDLIEYDFTPETWESALVYAASVVRPDITDGSSQSSGKCFFRPKFNLHKGTGRKSVKARFTVKLFEGPALPWNLQTRIGLKSAASFISDPNWVNRNAVAAPGEIVSVFGAGLGPSVPAVARVSGDGRMGADLLAGTRVFFSEVPARILYTSRNQINLLVPNALVPLSLLPTRNTDPVWLRVEHNGRASNSIPVKVVPCRLGVFTLDGSGRGQAAALNSDQTLNGPSNPARPGSVVSFFVTGAGPMEPEVAEDLVIVDTSHGLRWKPTVIIDYSQARVLYAGGAPGLVAGVQQLNVEVPAFSGSSSGVKTVVLSVGSRRVPDSSGWNSGGCGVGQQLTIAVEVP